MNSEGPLQKVHAHGVFPESDERRVLVVYVYGKGPGARAARLPAHGKPAIPRGPTANSGLINWLIN